MIRTFFGWSALVAISAAPLISTAALAQATTRPMPSQPVPLPSPMPDRPTTLPMPIPERPQIQPPRPLPIPERPFPERPTPLPGPGQGGNWGGGGSGGQQWDRTIRCSSSNRRYVECRADASGGADIVRVISGSCNQNNWGYRADAVWVRNNCRADIGVRGTNWSGGGGGNNWQTSTVRCQSKGYRYQACRADARGGAQISRVIAGDCRRGNWGTRDTEVWVNRGCQADFLVRGYGQRPEQGGGGPSAGAIIGGVAIAAGLAALIAAATKKKTPEAAAETTMPEPTPPASTGPARININTGVVTAAARPSFQTCLDEAARQIGATGGSEISLDEMQEIEPGNGGYRFRFRLKGVWPDETRTIGAFCRATPTKVVELEFN